MQQTFYWHDYETFGRSPASDRPAQFAGVRTDLDLQTIGEPLTLWCRPPNDYLPSPEACLVHGISPQHAAQHGLAEAEFMAVIHAELAAAGTCGVGYNSVRFDDEFTRFALYRNFFEPYEREWRDGNSRWDLIDVMRLAYALRPEGFNWPCGADGQVSFKLELLARANQIEHGQAHDALADVYATLALARRLKQQQPRLFKFCFEHRRKRAVAELLQPLRPQLLIHVSRMYSPSRHCLALVCPIAQHPDNPNGVIVFDLAQAPDQLGKLDSAQLARNLFGSDTAQERVGLKTVHLNKCPVVVTPNVLRPQDTQRLQLDLEQAKTNMCALLELPQLADKVRLAFSRPPQHETRAAELALYDGFISNDDRARLQQLRILSPSQLAIDAPVFDDQRLNELVFLYRARNYPDSLSEAERATWNHERCARLLGKDGSENLLNNYFDAIKDCRATRNLSELQRQLLQALENWPQCIGLGSGQ